MSTTYLAAQAAAEALLREILAAESATGPDDDHQAPGQAARQCEHVLADLMDRMDVGDCGWVIPLRVANEWAVLAYHPGSDGRCLGVSQEEARANGCTGWQAYVGEYEVPGWIAEQLAVTYGQLRSYYAEVEPLADGWGGRAGGCVQALGCYLANNPDIAAAPDEAPVPVKTLKYYRYPGYENEED